MNFKNVTPQKILKDSKIAALETKINLCGVAFLSSGKAGKNPIVRPGGLYSLSGSMIPKLDMNFSFSINLGTVLLSSGFLFRRVKGRTVESWLPKGGKLPVCKAKGFTNRAWQEGKPLLASFPLWFEKRKRRQYGKKQIKINEFQSDARRL